MIQQARLVDGPRKAACGELITIARDDLGGLRIEVPWGWTSNMQPELVDIFLDRIEFGIKKASEEEVNCRPILREWCIKAIQAEAEAWEPPDNTITRGELHDQAFAFWDGYQAALRKATPAPQ